MSLENSPQKRRTPVLLRIAYFAVCVIVLGVLAVACFVGGSRSARPAAVRTVCAGNLKKIGQALHRYHDAHGRFPPAYTVDEAGNPLHGWRTLILPYLEDSNFDRAALKSFYDQLDLTKPWNDPHNASVLRIVNPSCYSCPSLNESPNRTTYLALVTDDSVLRPAESLKTSDISNATASTIVVIEVPLDQSVPWMQPTDADEVQFLNISENSRLPHSNGFQTLFADGSLRFLPATTPQADRRKFIDAMANPNE